MSRRQKDPLRLVTTEERRFLERLSRSQSQPAAHVARAKAHGMRNELDRALSTTLVAGKKAAPGLHSIRVEDAVVIQLSRGPLWYPAEPDIHLGDSIDVPGLSTQAGIKWLGQRLVVHSVGRANIISKFTRPTY
jgi:hypothetical protein